MNILIIDDSKDFRKLARLYVTKELPKSRITEYEIEKLGKPEKDFNWGEFDALLLDYNLGGGENGFNWLTEFKSSPGFPPTIILTAEGDEYTAVKAIKLGAADYLSKADVSPKRLVEVIKEAIDYTPEKIAKLEKNKNQTEKSIINYHKKVAKKNKHPSIDAGYKFVRQIGQGAMSRVFLAERESDHLSICLKIMDIGDSSEEIAIMRFIQEAELIAGLSSPFVIKIYDYGLTNNYGFIAMEFFSRGDLKQRMELNLSPEIIFNYMTHIAYGLDAIHNIGIIHRDLKPANIMFRGDDSLALADFGISKKLDADLELTSAGQILGTPHYMSPEQGQGKPLDKRADIYSAGVLLYELLTKEKPYKANTPMALIYQHINSDIPKLPKALSDYQEIIDRTLAKKPENRYQSAAELIKVLEAAEQSCI